MASAVLLVDDERFARTVYADYLRLEGYDVEVAEDASAAVEALRKRHFDLLITDILLPGADGLELLTEAKKNDPNIEAIVITALDRVDPAVRAMKSGASDYLVKPVTPEALQVAVQRCLAARALLAENKVLRSHLRLFETCQRITASLDHSHAVSLALGAVRETLSASAVLFLELSSGKHLLSGFVGLEEEAALATTADITDRAASLGHDSVWIQPSEEGAARSLLLPVTDGDSALGAICAIVPGDVESEKLRSAEFVCSHLSLALQTLGHLRKIEHLAYLDDLTHLYNTRFLHLVLEREVQAARPFTVLFLDLDRFKSVNDEYGHLIGSKLLVEIARVIQGCMRDGDVVARYGGDEYVSVLLGVDSGGALKVSERIRRAIEDHVFLSREGLRVRITASIGLASFPEHASSRAEILDLADRAMYRGKRSTRNVVYIASRDLPPAPTTR